MQSGDSALRAAPVARQIPVGRSSCWVQQGTTFPRVSRIAAASILVAGPLLLVVRDLTHRVGHVLADPAFWLVLVGSLAVAGQLAIDLVAGRSISMARTSARSLPGCVSARCSR